MQKMKHFLKVLFITTFVFGFTGCEEEVDNELSARVSFSDYDKFESYKEAWVEPDEYVFTYKYSYGDSLVLAPITVTVKNGQSVFDYGENVVSDLYGNESINVEASALIKNISAIYDLIYSNYQSYLSEQNQSYWILYSLKYSKAENGLYYPSTTVEHIYPVNSGINGYGGTYIDISDLTIINQSDK